MSGTAKHYISLFTGAGGLDIGFNEAGFHGLLASDIMPQAKETFILNYPDEPYLLEDIRTLSISEIKKYVGDKKVSVIIGGPAPFRPCADGRALPGGGGKADPDSACRAARCGHHTWVPQRGCYRDPASGSSCGAGRDGPARGRTRTGDQRSGSIPEPLRRLCTGRGHQHHPGAGQTNAV